MYVDDDDDDAGGYTMLYWIAIVVEEMYRLMMGMYKVLVLMKRCCRCCSSRPVDDCWRSGRRSTFVNMDQIVLLLFPNIYGGAVLAMPSERKSLQ